MKSKLFKHLNLPEMYNIEVGEGNKITLRLVEISQVYQLFFVMGDLAVIAEMNIILCLILKYLNP
jgi:hypothetical protein